jgi:hypothetical protein
MTRRRGRAGNRGRVTAAVASVDQQVHEGAREEQQVGERHDDVRFVAGQQTRSRDHNEHEKRHLAPGDCLEPSARPRM